MKKKKILFLFGTRPEAIKMAPLIKTFEKDKNFEITLGITGQHKEMLKQVIDFFEIKENYQLNIMQPKQSLSGLTHRLIQKLDTEIFQKESFDLVIVQGDTTTVMTGALVAFYHKIPVAHLEAGLRSHDSYSPFPEEMNRVLTSRLADIHLCPTPLAKQNLINEGISKNIFVVGNTVIDALFWGIEKLNLSKNKEESAPLKILVTCHRRENHGKPFESICAAIQQIAELKPEIQIVYPVHLNPNIKDYAYQYLTAPNITLVEPMGYQELIKEMHESYVILTDSGGIQEEAPSLGKPVLVMRNVTERTEGIEAGNAILVGTDKEKIVKETIRLLEDNERYMQISQISNPYGDGRASEKILDIIKDYFQINSLN
ncbi:MAG: UDP-N-acetylglucosamine 2-epimerase (non-hydrolyzing) [Flavobacteriaceae bacterium]|nr:UDP-N-acetylglucosamine 2-epimerase (non-hydrolyzing) [Flavobacteriaceae bacterium]